MKGLFAGSSADVFHHVVDESIRRTGGPGSLGQLILRCAAAPDAAQLSAGLARLGADAWPLGARSRWSWRGLTWRVSGPAQLVIEHGAELDRLSVQHLHQRMPVGQSLRFGVAPDGVVVTWDHRLLDARSVMGLLSALPDLAAGGRLRDRWWEAGYRELPGVPRSSAGRGRLARVLLPLMRPSRLAQIWRPRHGAMAGPLVVCDLRLTAEETAQLDVRLRAVTGRFGETPFLLAALAAALETLGGERGNLLFPLAVDARPPRVARRLANFHGFSVLMLPAGVASTDLAAAARTLRDAQRNWLAAGGLEAMSSSLTFFPIIGKRLARAQLGNFRPGLAATCLIANTAMVQVPTQWLGTTVLGVDHRVSLPHAPGLAVIFNRDRRGAGAGIMATEAVAADVAPASLAEALRYQLLFRPLLSAATPSPPG